MIYILLSDSFLPYIPRWREFYGFKRTESIIQNLKTKDKRYITPNTLKISSNQLFSLIEKRGFILQHTKVFDAFLIKKAPYNIVSTPEYLTGLFSIHVLTSIIPPFSLELQKNDLVIDMAAAPGIKTSLLAQKLRNRGIIIAIEKSKARIPALRANISRLGVKNTIILFLDSMKLSFNDIMADHILLDAPCSGTGLKVEKNKRSSPRKMRDILRNTIIQKRLLEVGWNHLKPRGTLVYSTCSLEPEEGEIQIHNFLNRHTDEVEVLPISFDIGIAGNQTNWKFPLNSQLSKTKRIFPDSGIDGFFVALLRKVGQ